MLLTLISIFFCVPLYIIFCYSLLILMTRNISLKQWLAYKEFVYKLSTKIMGLQFLSTCWHLISTRPFVSFNLSIFNGYSFRTTSKNKVFGFQPQTSFLHTIVSDVAVCNLKDHLIHVYAHTLGLQLLGYLSTTFVD